MAPPTWSVGQVLTASDVNTWFVDRAAYTTVAEHYTSSVTLGNSASLLLPADANALYRWEMYLLYEGGTLGASDLRFNFAVPSGTTAAFQYLGYNAAGNDETRLGWVLPMSDNFGGTEGAGNLRSLTLRGTIDTAAASGTFQARLAQQASSAVSTIVHVGSYMTLQRIG
jgi:hypothetical protein